MAANITVTRAPSAGAPELIRSPRSLELVKLAGSSTAVDDTGTYTVQSFPVDANTIIIGGGFDISAISGQQVTIRAKFALGNAINHVWLASGL
jgi:hypothetical protein